MLTKPTKLFIGLSVIGIVFWQVYAYFSFEVTALEGLFISFIQIICSLLLAVITIRFIQIKREWNEYVNVFGTFHLMAFIIGLIQLRLLD